MARPNTADDLGQLPVTDRQGELERLSSIVLSAALPNDRFKMRDERTDDARVDASLQLLIDSRPTNLRAQFHLMEHNCQANIRGIGKQKRDEQGKRTHLANLWIVERTFFGVSRWRSLLICWDKKPENYLANLNVACAMIWFRRAYKEGSVLLG